MSRTVCYEQAVQWLASMALAISAATPVAQPSVLLVTVDTLRADRLTPEQMPDLWRLARGGAVFERAWADVPLTLPSHATILTGVGVETHGVRDNVGFALPADVPTLAERFSEHGYATAAFVSGFPLRRGCGLERGFQIYDDNLDAQPYGAGSEHLERSAPNTRAAASRWLRSRGNAPFFLWVHFFDPHTPYEGSYDREVALADGAVGTLIRDARMAVRQLWVVVVGDHGEGLGAHGEQTHGVFLYEETMRVPLVILPPEPSAGRTPLTPAGTRDIGVTLLYAAGVDATLAAGDAAALVAAYPEQWRHAPPPAPRAARGALYMESIHGMIAYRLAPLRGRLRWPFKCIAAPKREAYDLERDPGETRNLFAKEPGLCQRQLASLPDVRSAGASRGPALEEREALEALGYVGSAGPADSLACPGCPDPKEVAASLGLVETGHREALANHPKRARAPLVRALGIDPRNPVALADLANIAARDGEINRATALYERALAVTPTDPKLLTSLGTLASRRGDQREAIRLHERALALDETFHPAAFNRAIALHRLGRDAEALRELERLQREAPGLPGLAEAVAAIRSAHGRVRRDVP